MVWFVKRVDGICEQRATLTGRGGGGERSLGGKSRITISAPVGISGANFPSDVEIIQDALNNVPKEKGGAVPALAVDGKCGPKTKNAIQTFQLKHFGWKGSDGLIEPPKQTLAKLNEVLGRTGNTASSEDLVAPRVIKLAMSFVFAARANMLQASPFVDTKDSSGGMIPSFSRERLMFLLNKHFSIDSHDNRRKAFNYIQHKYALMEQVFQRPGGLWGIAVFERDPIDENHIAYVWATGFHKPGQTIYYKGIKMRLDSIYLCQRFFNIIDLNEQAFAVTHELAHFVAPFLEILDYAYNREGAPRGSKVRNLAPQMKIINAECYSNFAYEAYTGQEPWRFP